MLSSASDRTRVGAALWRIHVENLTKRRDKYFGVLCAGECGNAVDDKEGHAVEPSLLSLQALVSRPPKQTMTRPRIGRSLIPGRS